MIAWRQIGIRQTGLPFGISRAFCRRSSAAARKPRSRCWKPPPRCCVRAAVADQDNPDTGLEEACRRVVEVAVDVVRRNVGVVRAAAQYESIYPERWGTIRATGSGMVDLATPLLLARMGRGRIPAKTRSIGFAFQMMFGTLCNAVLHKPKLVSLDEPEMVDRLALTMFLQLQHEARAEKPAK
jgi:hypothetical protein